jgi:hypothetical protein
MLLLSGITHLNTLINIPDFIYKGKLVAANRLLAIAVQLVLSGIVLSSRNTKAFPSKPSALGVLPAACFENMNALDSLGLQDFADLAQNVTGAATNTTQNATQIWDNIQAATSARSGLSEYLTLIVFTIFALLFLILELLEALLFPQTYLHWLSISLSVTSEIASVAIAILTTSRYFSLRDGMEIPSWFDNAGQDKWTYSQIVPMLLLGSSSITLITAVTGKIIVEFTRGMQILTNLQRVLLVTKPEDIPMLQRKLPTLFLLYRTKHRKVRHNMQKWRINMPIRNRTMR